MSDKNTKRGFGGKGYYIALILCAVAIGISGYVYYSNAADDQTVSNPDTPVAATDQLSGTTQTTKDAADSTQMTIPSETVKPTTGRLSTCSPVQGQTVAEYAMECLSYNQTTRDWRVHNGVDIAAEAGTDVCAAADGQVYTVYEDDEMGTTVVIRHDGGYVTKYSSLDPAVKVSAGDTVRMGQTIGTVGNTALMETALGAHLHFGVSLNDEPMDPAGFVGME